MDTDLFKKHFSQIKDMRINRKKEHSLLEVLAIIILGVLSGCRGYGEIEWYGKQKEEGK